MQSISFVRFVVDQKRDSFLVFKYAYRCESGSAFVKHKRNSLCEISFSLLPRAEMPETWQSLL